MFNLHFSWWVKLNIEHWCYGVPLPLICVFELPVEGRNDLKVVPDIARVALHVDQQPRYTLNKTFQTGSKQLAGRSLLTKPTFLFVIGASLIAPQHMNFPPPLSHYGASTPSPAMYPSPPQFVYWGYSSGPLSPTSAYIGPLQIPPHGFAHSPLDRSTLVGWVLSWISLWHFPIDKLSAAFCKNSRKSTFRKSRLLLR